MQLSKNVLLRLTHILIENLLLIVPCDICGIALKRSKQNYYTNYFESNLTNIKNDWKSIKIIVFMRSSSLITPT